jgi:hypothetical protein
MGNKWQQKKINQERMSYLTKEENKLREKYGINWRIDASKEEMMKIYALEDSIDWSDID